MSSRAPLRVHLYGRHVADVIDTGFGDTALRYTSEAVEDPLRSRLSLSLPVQHDMYATAGPGGRWVRSLLPEGRALAWAVEHFGIPEDDRYGLIAVLGRDVAGAVQVLAPDADRASHGRYEPVDDIDLAEIVGRAHRFGLGLDRARGVRLSLAGLQDKVLLHRSDGRYVLPVEGAPSTLIVKPQPGSGIAEDVPSLDGLATNELLCLVLASRCGLETADAWIDVFGDTRALVVERYDRTVGRDGSVGRIHQEDLLGALGTDPMLKYERPQVERRTPAGGWDAAAPGVGRGGPSLRRLAEVLTTHLGRTGTLPLLQALAFNVAIGNADAHARNFSVLLLEDGEVRFAPLYDLIATRFWDHLDAEPGQLVNGRDHIDAVSISDLVAEATAWGLPPRLARDRVDRLLDSVVSEADGAVEECVRRGGEPAVASALAQLISGRVLAMRARRSGA